MTMHELTQIALLGTGRSALPQGVSGGKIDALLAQLDPAQMEKTFLSAAALILAHRRAGSLPPKLGDQLPSSCPPDELPWSGVPASTLLRRLLDGDHPDLLPEWLNLAANAKCLARPELLPALLAKGQTQANLRERVLPVLGERGKWLASQNGDWAWVAGATDDPEVWQTGEKSARVLFLRNLRRTNPAKARELLASTWKQESPEDRASFLAELNEQLSPEDEAFLEAALDDKRKEVRRAASSLLVQIPSSALVRRMTERARPLLKFTPGESGSVLKMKRAKKAVLDVELPAQHDKAMERDGIESRPPTAFGEKAWWLIQILEAVPLSTWTSAWGVSPDMILEASSAGDWDKEFFEAWVRAACTQRDETWGDRLFEIALERNRADKFEELLAALSVPRREARLAEVLASSDAKLSAIQGILISKCTHDWSIQMSRDVLAWLRRAIAENIVDWRLQNQLKDLARFLHPATLTEATTGWPTHSPHWESRSKGVDDFFAAVQFRSDLHASFKT